MISLEKKPVVSLVKEAGEQVAAAGLGEQKAKVALLMDYSGSMRSAYKEGVVQAIAERALALAAQFDDDQAIDVFFFGTQAWYAGEITLEDYAGAIDRLTAGRHMGTTNYAAAMRLVREHYRGGGRRGLFGRRKHADAAVEFPAYVMFFTDGHPDSEAEAKRELREASAEGIFWQFVGIGDERFTFLEKLDDLDGRVIDNANFFAVRSSDRMPDTVLFAKLLTEFPGWLPQARQHGLIR